MMDSSRESEGLVGRALCEADIVVEVELMLSCCCARVCV
jgi:hypothetical protein